MAPADFSAKDYLQHKQAGAFSTLGGVAGTVGGAMLGHELGGPLGDSISERLPEAYEQGVNSRLESMRVSDDVLPSALHEPAGQVEDAVNRLRHHGSIEQGRQLVGGVSDVAGQHGAAIGAGVGGLTGLGVGRAIGHEFDHSGKISAAAYLATKRAEADPKDEKPSGKDIAKGVALGGVGAGLGVSALHLSGLRDVIKDTVGGAM